MNFFTGYRTGPDERVTQEGSLKELFVIFENFFSGLTNENFIVGFQPRSRLARNKLVLA
jgi:hypothetical protein